MTSVTAEIAGSAIQFNNASGQVGRLRQPAIDAVTLNIEPGELVDVCLPPED